MATINAWGSDDPAEVGKGGTGATTFGDGYVLLGSGTSPVSALDVTAKGSLLVGDGTTDPVALAVGSNNLVLTSDSSEAAGVKWAAGGSGGGLTFISSVTGSDTSSMDFTSGIDSTYSMYFFMVYDMYPNTSNQELMIRTSADGVTFDSSGYSGLSWGEAFRKSNSTSIYMTDDVSNLGDSFNYRGCAYLYDPSNAATYTYATGMGAYYYSGRKGASFAGQRTSAAVVQGIRFMAASGNITGTVEMYGW